MAQTTSDSILEGDL